MFLTEFSLILSIFLLNILSKFSYFSFIISFSLILLSTFLSECLYLFKISGLLKCSVKSKIFFHYQLVFYILLVLQFQNLSYINRLYKNMASCFFINCVFKNIMFYYFLRIYDVIKIIVMTCFLLIAYLKMTYFYYFLRIRNNRDDMFFVNCVFENDIFSVYFITLSLSIQLLKSFE